MSSGLFNVLQDMNEIHSAVLKSLAERRFGNSMTLLHQLYNLATLAMDGVNDEKLQHMMPSHFRLRRYVAGAKAAVRVFDTKSGTFVELQAGDKGSHLLLCAGSLLVAEFSDAASAQTTTQIW